MSEGYAKVLDGLKLAFPDLDLEDPNFKGSPNRMARALIEICSGLGIKEDSVFSQTFPAESYDQMVILKDIEYTSLCSHHFFPFSGTASVGYIPNGESHEHGGGKVVGLSKLARIVDAFAQRPQLQERLSYNVAHSIHMHLNPKGVMVMVKGQHGCLNCRGAKKRDAEMITTSVEGVFKDQPALREEFLKLIQK